MLHLMSAIRLHRFWLISSVYVCLIAASQIMPCALAQENPGQIAEQAKAVFKKRCVSCHSQSQSRGGLDMTTLDSVLAGSTSGSVVERGKPAESLVYTLAAHIDAPKMPPNAPRIPERELKAISTWIESLKADNSPVLDKASMTAADSSALAPVNQVRDGLVPIAPLPGPLCITAMAHSGTLLAISGLHQVLLYDTSLDQWRGALDFPEGDVFAIRFTQDGTRLIAGGGMGGLSGVIVAWDMHTHQRQRTVAIDDDVVLSLAVTADGRMAAAAGPTRSISVIDLSDGNRKHTLNKHADWVTSLAFSSDGVLLASGDRFGSIYVWDAAGGKLFDTASNHTGTITSLHFTPDNDRLWSSGKDGQARLWDLRESKLIRQCKLCENGIVDSTLTQGRLIALTNDSHITTIQDDGNPVKLGTTQGDPARCTIVTTANSENIVIGDCNSTLHWLDKDGQQVKTVALPVQPKPLALTRFVPGPVERQLQVLEQMDAAAEKKPSTAEVLARSTQALAASQELLEQTRQSLSKLEAEIRELSELIQSLESRE